MLSLLESHYDQTIAQWCERLMLSQLESHYDQTIAQWCERLMLSRLESHYDQTIAQWCECLMLSQLESHYDQTIAQWCERLMLSRLESHYDQTITQWCERLVLSLLESHYVQTIAQWCERLMLSLLESHWFFGTKNIFKCVVCIIYSIQEKKNIKKQPTRSKPITVWLLMRIDPKLTTHQLVGTPLYYSMPHEICFQLLSYLQCQVVCVGFIQVRCQYLYRVASTSQLPQGVRY